MIDIQVIASIEGQVRIRRKLSKSLFFIDIQPSNTDERKSQVFFRTDDGSLDDVAFQDAFRACRPGQIIRIQVGDPLDPNEQLNKDYKVWQSNKPVEIIVSVGRDAFIQDRPLGSKMPKVIRSSHGEKVEKSSLVCKYWINKNVCQRGSECLFQHPTGDEFDKARKEWLEQRETERKKATFDPNDPHHSKKPHGLRALIFADWVRKTFHEELKAGGVLDVAGGKGEISMLLCRGFGIPSTVVEPNQRKLPSYWYTRLRRFLHRFEEDNDLSQPDWKSQKIHIDLKSWPHDIEPTYLHTFLDDAFLEQHKELLSTISVFVGLHSDQATIPIVEAALKAGKAFAVVPCCVFSHDNRSRHLKSGELVTTTEQQIQYICEKDTQGRGPIQTAYLDFEGKNRVVYWKP